jgi:hypothetical protein
MDGAVIERFRGVVGDLAVIRIGAAIEQQLGQFRMMCDARGAVERAFPFGLGLVVLCEEAGVGVGARIEQGRGGLQKTFGASGFEPQKFGEAEMRKGVPVARAAFGGGVCRIAGEEARDRLVVAEQGAVCMSLLATSGCAARISRARSSVPCHTDALMNSALGSSGMTG